MLKVESLTQPLFPWQTLPSILPHSSQTALRGRQYSPFSINENTEAYRRQRIYIQTSSKLSALPLVPWEKALPQWAEDRKGMTEVSVAAPCHEPAPGGLLSHSWALRLTAISQKHTGYALALDRRHKTWRKVIGRLDLGQEASPVAQW